MWWYSIDTNLLQQIRAQCLQCLRLHISHHNCVSDFLWRVLLRKRFLWRPSPRRWVTNVWAWSHASVSRVDVREDSPVATAHETHIYGELVHFKSYQRFLAFTFRNRLPNSPISSSLFSPAQQSTLWGCHPTIKDLNHGNHNSSKMSYYYGGVRKVTWSAHEVTVALQCLHG